MRRRRLLFGLVSALLVLVVVVAIDQAAGRWGRVDPITAYRRAHPSYHHDLRPSVRVTAQWGPLRYRLATNSLAFRDRAVREVALGADRRRVLLMGDSFTEGVGVEWEETFAGRLALAGAPDVEVLNAGVIGYSPKTYLAKTRHLLENVGLRFDELFVLVDMSDIPNEIVYIGWEPRAGQPEPAPRPSLSSRLLHGSLILRRLGLARRPKAPPVAWNFHGMPFAEDLNRAVFRDPAFNDEEHWTLEYKYARQGMQLAESHMEELARLCREHGVALTVVIYPWRANIFAGELDHPQVALWSAFAARSGARLVNLFPVFIRAGADPRETIQRYFIPGDVHWSAAGHEVVAGELAGLLRAQQPSQR